jgi:hypothetical protein
MLHAALETEVAVYLQAHGPDPDAASARGMRPPVVAIGDGALGFWAAVRDVWPKTHHSATASTSSATSSTSSRSGSSLA